MGSNLGTRPAPQWKRHLDDVSLVDLFAAADAVEALMQHPGWAHLIRLVDAEIAEVDAQLDGGLLDSHADYARAHGVRFGLKSLREAGDAIVLTGQRRLEEQQAKHERDAGSSRGEV